MLINDWLSSFSSSMLRKRNALSRLTSLSRRPSRTRSSSRPFAHPCLFSKQLEPLEDRLLLAAATAELSISVAEGDSFPSTVVVATVTTSVPVSGDQFVDAAITTSSDEDFRFGRLIDSATLTIADGETSATETFTLIDDGTINLPGTVFIRLLNPSSGISERRTPQIISLVTRLSPVPPALLDGANGVVIEGAGKGVGIGDFNGDGFDDFAFIDRSANGDAALVQVVFGQPESFGASINIDSLIASNGFAFQSPEMDNVRTAVFGDADLNGDGLSDLLITTNSETSFIIYGRTDGIASQLTSSDLVGDEGALLNTLGSRTPVFAGDLNGDGFEDIAFREGSVDFENDSTAVVFGSADGFASSIDSMTLDGTDGFRLTGGLHSRRPVSAGDINGDGFDDILISGNFRDETFASGGYLFGGSASVIYGKSGGFDPTVTPSGFDGFQILDGQSGRFGKSISGGGDINGDGLDDVLIGAPLENGAIDFNGFYGGGTGRAVVIYGNSSGFTPRVSSFVDGTDGIVFLGLVRGSNTGSTVSIVGDVNGDGFDDVLIDAPERIFGDPRESFLIYGQPFSAGAETQIGTDVADVLAADRGEEAIDVLIGGLSNDTLISDGGPDVLRGSEGHDILSIPDADFSTTRRLVGGNGNDTIRLDGADIVFDLTAISDNRITGIEVVDIRGSGSNTLTLDVREVLNASGTSNTLLVRKGNDDTVNIGTGWFPRGRQTIDSVAYDVFEQGAAVLGLQALTSAETVALPVGGGSYTVGVSGPNLEIQQTLPTTSLVASLPLASLGNLIINGSSAADIVILEDSTNVGGPIFFNAGGGGDLFDASATSLVTRFHGGSGNDTFLGGSGNDRFDGGSGADSATGGSGNDSLIGNAGNDTLAGNDGDDRINGNSGRDVLSGNDGNDTVLGGSGTDTLDGGAGADFVNGQGGQADIVAGGDGDGDDTLRGGASDVLLPGSAGTVPVNPTSPGDGSTLNVTLPATGGPFTVLVDGSQLKVTSPSETVVDVPLSNISDISIAGSLGDDSVVLDATLATLIRSVTFIGGAGNDFFDTSAVSLLTSFVGGAGNDLLTGGGGRDIFNGGDGDDSARGGSGDDILNGDNGDDLLVGDAGNDLLNGNGGQDSLFGRDGDDTLLGGRDTDLLDGGDGSDAVNGQGGTGDIVAGGGGGSDTLRGDSSDTLTDGRSGSSAVSSLDGRLVGIRGVFGISSGFTADGVLLVTLPSSPENYIVLLREGSILVLQPEELLALHPGSILRPNVPLADVTDIVINGGLSGNAVTFDQSMSVFAGNVTFNGDAGNDSLDVSLISANVVFNGGDGDDTLIGGSGNDVANGGAGNDSIFTGAGTDLIHAGIGNDFVDAGSDADTVFGDDGDDVLIGGAGNDILNGNGGSDTITGGDGDDKLLGGADADSLDGGLGDDTVRGQGGDLDVAIGGGGLDVVVP